MTPRHNYLDSAVRKDGNHYARRESSLAVQYGVEDEKHCAYNQTRERFLGAEVDVVDFSIAALDTRLPALAPSSGVGLWLVPFKGISPTSACVPVDLVYLDRDCTVIDAVESFPISRASALSALAESVLVLPSDTIRSTETQPGDRLILCSRDEIKQRLQRLPNSSVDTESEQTAALVKDGPLRSSNGRLLHWDDRSWPKNSMETVSAVDPTPIELLKEATSSSPGLQETGPIETAALEPAAIETSRIEPAQNGAPPARTWWQRLLAPDPPRRDPRESLPGLVAYFFTGGAPEPHGVRDISLSGMYVLTKERWYPGTVVRITLTDRFKPTAERSITVNMAAVRWGNDGVGLKFLLQSGKDRRQGQFGGVNKIHVDQFLQRLRPMAG